MRNSKTTSNQKLQIVNGNEKLDTILSQVKASQISRQKIGNTHNGFRSLASIILERLDNIHINDQAIISGKR